MVGLAWALVRDLREDPVVVRRKYAVAAVEKAVVTGATLHGDDFALSVEPADEPVLGEGDTTPSEAARSRAADLRPTAAAPPPRTCV